MADASQLLHWMKQAAVDAVEHTKPMQLVYGKVLSTEPLSVRLDQRTTLEAVFLKRLAYRGRTSTSDGMFDTDVIEFEVGDIVAMLRQQGGQQYLILGKAV